MKRKERHQLKQDDFLVWLEQTVTWFSENRRFIGTATVAVLLVGLLGGGVYSYRAKQENKAQALLAEALDLYHGHISEGSIVQGDSPAAFQSSEERYREALAAFEAVAEAFPDLEQGRQARYYAGLCESGLTRHENAESLLEKARGGRRDLLHYLASQALAHVKAEKGDFEGAAELYRGLIGDPKNPFPKDCLLFGLAQAQEQAGHLEEAQRSYHRFLNEYSDSQLRGQVQQRSDLLELRLGT